MPHATESRWDSVSDADLLCAVARNDEAALRELHARYACHLLALAQHLQLHQPERRVQDAFLAVRAHAHFHARTALEARTWVVAIAHRALTSTGDFP